MLGASCKRASYSQSRATGVDSLGVEVDHEHFGRDSNQALELGGHSDDVRSGVFNDKGGVALMISQRQAISLTAWIMGIVIPSHPRISRTYRSVLTATLSM